MANVSAASNAPGQVAWGGKLLWVLSVLYALAALGSIAEGKTVATLLCLLTCAVANPAVTRFLVEKCNVPLKGWPKAVLVISLAVAIFTLFRDANPAPATVADSKSPAAVTAQAAPQKAPDTIQSKQAGYEGTLTGEIASLQKGFDTSKFTASKDTITYGLVLFDVWAKLYAEGDRYPLDAKQRHLRAQFRSLVIATQRRVYPIFRKAWTKHVSDALWEHDIEAHTLGARNDRVEFVGAIFAANAGKKQVNDSLWDSLKLLRFKQSRYKWYKDASEFTYWNVEGPGDSDLAYFEHGNARIVKP